MWDTLALAEYLHEVCPEAQLLPTDRAARAHCRAISGEMHSGFASLRASLPMNLRAHFPKFKVWSRAQADIDRICTQAATFASDDHVDVEVRQQLATMLFDNAEMRKQLNAYTEGILMQTMERLDQLGAHDKDAAKQLTAGVTGATDMVSGLLKGPKDQKV